MNAPFQTRREVAPRPTVVPPRPTHDARFLTGGGIVATIVLDGATYILRITRQNKLILTK